MTNSIDVEAGDVADAVHVVVMLLEKLLSKPMARTGGKGALENETFDLPKADVSALFYAAYHCQSQAVRLTATVEGGEA